MPLVTSPPIGQQNGNVVTQFTDTTNLSAVTYTYPTQQTSLVVENSGEKDIFVTVGSYTNQVVNADKKWRVDVPFTSFSVRSDVNSQEFIATSISDNSLTSQLDGKATKTFVNIKDYGAKGDGAGNSVDYDAWVVASALAGPNGVVFFPKTAANNYWLVTGTAMSFENSPYIMTETPNVRITGWFNSDKLKYMKPLTPFELSSGSLVKQVNPYVNEDSIIKTALIKNKPTQKLTKINFTTDVLFKSFTGSAFNVLANPTNLTTDSFSHNSGSTTHNFVTSILANGDYVEVLYEKDATLPAAGLYTVIIKTDLFFHVLQFDPLAYTFGHNKWAVGTGAVTAVSSNTVPEPYQLKENRALLFGIKNVDGKIFELYINGLLFYVFNIGAEVFDVVGFGNFKETNGMVTYSCGLKVQNYNNPDYRNKNMWNFGDSITFGAASYIDYPTMLSKMLNYTPKFKNVVVNNKAVGGNTSAQCLSVVNANIASITSSDIVTVQIGTNDCQQGVLADTYIANMTTIIDTIRTKTNNLAIASFPMYTSTFPNYDKIALYNARLKKLCAEKGVKFVDNLGNFGNNTDLYNDGIHPTERGLLLLAKGFYDAILEMYGVA